MPIAIITLCLIVAAAIGGGVSIAAEQSLPGEPLYMFKVSVNARVEEFFGHSQATTSIQKKLDI